MRGTYNFEDKNEFYYWIDVVKPALCKLESGELDEVDYSNDNISPCLLGKVLEELGYSESHGEFDKETMYVYYYSSITHKKLCIIADIEIFSLNLSICEEEAEDEEYDAYYYLELQ